MASGNAIRGARVGSGPMRPTERAEPAPRRVVRYWCANGHVSEPAFAAEATVPATWECVRCGLPAGQDPDDPPGRPRTEPYKSHLAYVKERRSDADGEAILAEALARLRQSRGE
ncbi:MAG TPA: RNA polymerase-binding protein RbpA [Micromonosporaceae bacterium]